MTDRMDMTQEPPAPRDDPTRDKIKAAAQRLFSTHGLDGVSVRDIVKAAGARNGASLHYYFGSKEGLITELVLDGARRSEEGRRRALDLLEAQGGPQRVADIVRLLVEVEIGLHSPAPTEARAGLGHMRFIVALQISHRNLMRTVLDGQQNTAYLKCLAYLRRLMPDLPPDVVNQRLIFMYIILTTSLAAREAAFEHDPTGGKLWSSPHALENLIASITGALEGPFPA
jgi:AcrR family transcriptional regulator